MWSSIKSHIMQELQGSLGLGGQVAGQRLQAGPEVVAAAGGWRQQREATAGSVRIRGLE